VTTGAREEDLLEAIYASPHDQAAREVYADWLSDRGDPRGELIMLQLRGRDPARANEIVRAHGEEWFGMLARLPRDGWLLGWWGGFVETMTYERGAGPRMAAYASAADIGRAVGQAFRHPAASRLVHTLRMNTDDRQCVRAILAGASQGPRPRLSTLDVYLLGGTPMRFGADEFALLFGALPALQRLELKGPFELSPGCLRHATLETLYLHAPYDFVDCDLPALTTAQLMRADAATIDALANAAPELASLFVMYTHALDDDAIRARLPNLDRLVVQRRTES
jgi:uncharacterized protein (TIGR02996 family)